MYNWHVSRKDQQVDWDRQVGELECNVDLGHSNKQKGDLLIKTLLHAATSHQKLHRVAILNEKLWSANHDTQ